MLHISDVAIDIEHPHTEIVGVQQETSLDKPQIFLPDWKIWEKCIEESLRSSELIQIRFASVYDGSLAIAICPDQGIHPNDADPEADAHDLLVGKHAFGFILSAATLRRLRGVIDLAIASGE